MSLALLIASLIGTAIQTIPGIPAALAAAAGSISSILGVLLKNGVGTSVTATTTSIVLASLQALVTQLKATTGLPASSLADLVLLEDALAAALAQNATITSVDPTKLQPITPLP